MNSSLVVLCVVIAALLGAMVFLATSQRRTTLCCKQIILGLHPGLTRNLELILEPSTTTLSFRQVHSISGGLTGLWKRWNNRVPLLQLAQLRCAMEPDCGPDIEKISRLKRRLTRATIRAALATLLAPVAPKLYVCAIQQALELYIAMTDRTHALYSDDSAPLCGHLLASVL